MNAVCAKRGSFPARPAPAAAQSLGRDRRSSKPRGAGQRWHGGSEKEGPRRISLNELHRAQPAKCPIGDHRDAMDPPTFCGLPCQAGANLIWSERMSASPPSRCRARRDRRGVKAPESRSCAASPRPRSRLPISAFLAFAENGLRAFARSLPMPLYLSGGAVAGTRPAPVGHHGDATPAAPCAIEVGDLGRLPCEDRARPHPAALRAVDRRGHALRGLSELRPRRNLVRQQAG